MQPVSKRYKQYARLHCAHSKACGRLYLSLGHILAGLLKNTPKENRKKEQKNDQWMAEEWGGGGGARARAREREREEDRTKETVREMVKETG